MVVAVIGVLLLAGGVRLLTYERYLPLIDHSDESYLYLLSRAWRGFPDEYMTQRLSGYPPLYPWLQGAVQSLFEQFSGRPWFLPIDYIFVMRQIALAAGVLTTGLVMLFGWQLAGNIAGLFAGLIWAFAPLVVDNNALAVADPIGYLWCALACAAAICAWRRESYGWLFVCLVGTILSVYTKYWTLFPALLWGVVATRLILKHRRAALVPLGLQFLVALVMAGGLLVYLSSSGLSELSPEMTTFTDSGVSNLFNWSLHLNNLSYFPKPIGEALFWGVMIAGLIAFVISRRQGWRTVDPVWVVILTVVAILAVVPISTFIYISSLKYVRHALPVTIVLIGLWGMAVAQIVWTLTHVDRGGWLATAAAGGIGAAALLPYGIENITLIQDYARTPIQVDLWHYTEASVPLDGMILMDPKSLVEDTWNRAWSGYDGSKSFEWWLEKAQIYTETPLEDYVDRGIVYFALSDDDRSRVYGSQRIDPTEFLSQLTLLKRIEATPQHLGASVEFYRLLPPTHTINYAFGDQISLVGYDLSAEILKAGETLTLRPYWRAANRPATNYSLFVHLYPATEEVLLAQWDGSPAAPARPTLTWDDADELLIGSDVTLTLPADMPAGEYRLALGLYDYTTGVRLNADETPSYYPLTITVL